MTLNKITIIAMALVAFIMSYNQLLHPKLSVAILAQNGVYAYFSIIFVPILMGIFLKQVKAWIPFTTAIVAVVTHFSIYYLLPYFHNQGISFGVFNVFLKGEVRNPAIAASSAILLSLSVGLVLLIINRISNAHKNHN